jgi:hypothetical protein
VAEGLTDKEIAGRLSISEHTVHRHIANIMTKADAPSDIRAKVLSSVAAGDTIAFEVEMTGTHDGPRWSCPNGHPLHAICARKASRQTKVLVEPGCRGGTLPI